MNPFYLVITFILTLKVLVYPAYYSTDFDVHKNWMRITTTKHISEWYYDVRKLFLIKYLKTFSVWTLDYPPLFAYLEYVLGTISYYVDANMLSEVYILLFNIMRIIWYLMIKFALLSWDLQLFWVICSIFPRLSSQSEQFRANSRINFQKQKHSWLWFLSAYF